MIFPDNFEEKLGFSKIRSLVRSATLCGLGARHVDAMAFSADSDRLFREFNLLDEMMHVLADTKRPMPTDGFCDLTEALARIRLAGTYLSAGELFDLRRSLTAVSALVKYFSTEGPVAPPYPLLRLMALEHEGLTSQLSPLLADIGRILDEQGEIRDNASAELLRIRRETDQTLSGIGKLLRNILRQAQSEGFVESDVTPTVRDGRLVIPVAPAYKRRLHGIVHDESATGKTVYIEPSEVVDANNRVRELEAEEQQEIIHILTEITSRIRPMLPDLLAAHDFLGDIDFLRAKARFAGEIEGCVPHIADGKGDSVETDWVQARHPLLYIRYNAEGKRVVPLDIAINARQRIVLISGPNAGGKSVCLETLGLVQYMFQCGLPVPMRYNSTCAVYDDILIDIGDQQSIDNDLSTYSSHLTNMKLFLRNASARTLLLIDEMGSGTEPQIGGAIAQAILGGLNHKEARGVITTHFNNLKLFADDTPGIVNGAMLYDQTNMRPLFMLEVGRPGSSFAIEIAHKIGLPADIISQAKEIVGSDYVNVDKYLHDIQRDRRYWQLKRDKIHQQEKDLDELKARLNERLEKIQTQRRDMLEKAQNEASRLLSEANAQIEKTIRDIKEAQAEKEATRSIRKDFREFVDKVNTPRPESAPSRRRDKGGTKRDSQKKKAETPSFAPGDHVRIKGQTTVGEILSSNGSQCLVAFGMIKSTLDIARLEKVSVSQNTGSKGSFIEQAMHSAVHDASVSDEMRSRRLRFKTELDIRGMRADEALSAVSYYIDDAVMLSVPQVRILHGTGTGALRQVVRQYLGTVQGISGYHDEHVQFGGTGITVVEIE